MLIIPAIYMQNGNCISLYKGRPEDQKKIYPTSPLNKAREFYRDGASMIHLIDLDGSMNGGPVNSKIIEKICREVSIPIEVGGGVRSIDAIENLFSLGASRVILGVSARELIPEALNRFGPEKILFGIKARQEKVESESLPPDSDEVLEIAEQAISKGITQIVYKDMERVGTLFHPNYDEIERLFYFMEEGISVFSCGGVVSLQDLEILQSLGTAGVVVGRAFMEYKMNLKSATARYESTQDRLLALSLLPVSRAR